MNLAKLQKTSIRHLVRRKLQYSLFRQKWNIGVTEHPAAAVAGLEGFKKQKKALDNLLWMEERKDAFAADPFITCQPGLQDDYLIFFEYFPWQSKRGEIHCVKFSSGKFGASRVSLSSPFHLSYPYIFCDPEKLVIIPEHAASGALSRYSFDQQGVTNSKEIIDSQLSLVDSTIIYLNDKYWIFATHAGPGVNTDLYIYYSELLKGPWVGHAQNPVKQDQSNARPAGQFIAHAGKLFRPAQDCGQHYGSGIVVNELKILSEDAFEEVPVSEIRPTVCSAYKYGLHTISSAGHFTVVDGARIESSLHPRLDILGNFLLSNSAPRQLPLRSDARASVPIPNSDARSDYTLI